MTRKQILLQVLWFPWTLWCGVVFALALIIGFPILFIAVSSRNESWIRKVHYFPPYACKILLFLWGIRIKIYDRDMMVSDRQVIYISNHTSYLDGLVACAIIPNFLKFLGKGEILNWPVMGYLMKNLYVPVFRDDKESRSWSMQEMTEKLKTGASFYLCPEGTCNTGTEFLTLLHSGAFRLAIDNKLPLEVLTFIGPRNIFPRKGLMIKPGKVTVYCHPNIETQDLKKGDAEHLKTKAKEIWITDLLKHYPAGHYPA